MPKHRILVVFGTRPEAIKMAPVVDRLSVTPDLEPIVCVTAQHRHMLDQVLGVFQIRPDIDLDIMKHGQDLYGVTTDVINGLRDVLRNVRPDLTMVHGDTTTSFATALASFYSETPVAHVEAGLRTYNLNAPFPEEANRQLTSRLTTYHYAPTEKARENLVNEGITNDSIVVTGNTVVDALLHTAGRLDGDATALERAEKRLRQARMEFGNRPYVLVTGHRRESFGAGLENVCRALSQIAAARPDIDIVYPVHLNPNVQGPVHDLLSSIENVRLIEPVDYEAFVLLLMRCLVVITDSGGIQEEAPSLGKPVLVTRATTERPEGIEAGILTMVGTDTQTIVTAAMNLLERVSSRESGVRKPNPYGDGHAAARIASHLVQVL